MSAPWPAKIFRRAGGWRRSLIVNDAELPLTDIEVDVLRDALAAHRAREPRGLRTYCASSLLHFISTGELGRDESPDRRMWREETLRAERGERKDGAQAPIDASDPAWWPTR